jgi:hypothetical protein
MSTYEKIHGRSIQAVTTDPTESTAEGQVWYNTTSDTFKSVVVNEAWASSGSLISARGFVSHTGTQTASLLAGGLSPAPTYFSASEEYNGSGWSTGGSLPAATYALSSAGTQTAALVFGGANSSDTKQSTTYTYNGTSFSATPNSLNTARDQLSGGGTQTSALAVGGRVSSAVVTNMEEWNGSSWTNLTALPEKRGYTHANGPETAFFMASGALGDNAGSPYTSATLNYDGSSISTGENVNTARSAGGAAGDSANAIFYGGDISGTSQTKTEKYDGTSWSEVADMAVAKRGSGAGAGTSNAAALSAGAYGPPASASTEEFTSSANAITAAAWASGGSMNTARRGISSAKNATQDAALGAMGYTGANTGVNNAEEYDGSSWTNVSTVPTSRYFGGGFGIQTAGVVYGGYRAPSQQSATDEWDGSSWSTGGTLPSGQSNFAADGCGILTAGLSTLGMPGPAPSTIHYDGSSWTAVPGTLNTPRTSGSSFGTQTAAIAATGNVPGSPGNTLTSESYNGTAWTATSNAIYGGYGNGCGGTQTAGFIGGTYPNGTTSQGWDGSSWFTIPSISTGRSESGGAGTSTAGIIFAGSTTNPTTYTAATEEFTGETTAVNVKTLTQS